MPSLAALFLALAAAAAPSLARADGEVCRVGTMAFEGREACGLMQRIRNGEQVAFRPFAVMALVNDLCEALEGRMDERLRNDQRKTLFRTLDGFDCYRKGEPIRVPPMRGASFIRYPLVLEQRLTRRR